jgi:hypothetical protein
MEPLAGEPVITTCTLYHRRRDIVSIAVWGDPNYSNATQIISTATNTATEVATSLQTEGGENGAGPLASEIVMHLTQSGANEALIVLDQRDPGFFMSTF